MKNLEKLRNRYATMSLYNLLIGQRLVSIFDVVRVDHEFSDIAEEFDKANFNYRLGSTLNDAFEGSEAAKSADFMKWIQEIRDTKTQVKAFDFILNELRGFDPQDWRQAQASEFLQSAEKAKAPIWVVGQGDVAVTAVAGWISPNAQAFVGENFETMSLRLRTGTLKLVKPTCVVFVAESTDGKTILPGIFEFSGLTDWPDLEYSLLFRLNFNWKLESTGMLPRWTTG